MALRIPGKGVSAAHIPYCFIQNAKPCSLSANWGLNVPAKARPFPSCFKTW
jgi:hypothetical protein